VLTTKVTRLRSLLFRQQNGVNSVVRRVYLLKQSLLSLSQPSDTVSGLWMFMLTMLGSRRRQSVFVSIYSLFEIRNVINLSLCTRGLTRLDIREVYACLFSPVKSAIRMLFKQNSLKR